MHALPPCAAYWGLRQWLLRAANAAALRAGPGECGIEHADRRDSSTLARHYGAPRIHAELAAEGIRAGCKRFARLMAKAGFAAPAALLGNRHRAGARRAQAPDRVNRNFVAPAPNCLWVADITYIPTWAGFLYLAVVLDVFRRRIVGWAMETYLRTELVLKALNMALGQRRPAAVIHHSDQGSRYTSLAFGKRCDKATCGRQWVRSAIASTTPCARVLRHARMRTTRPPQLQTQIEARIAVFPVHRGMV